MSTTEGQTVMVQGRIVWCAGDLFSGKVKTIHGTQTPKLNEQGQQMKEYGFGLAVPKEALQQAEPGQPGHIWNAMHQEAFKLYPSGHIPPTFAMKYKDGDGIDDKGQPFSQREGYAGHIVFALTTSLPIKFFKFENGQNFQVNEGIKCGDYVKVQVQVKAHGPVGQGKPGLYMNPLAVQFLGFGKEIVNAPSGDQIFGTAAPVVPQGASVVPVDPMPGQQIIPASSVAAPAPHHGVLPQQFQPGAPAPVAPVVGQPAAGGMIPPPMPGGAAYPAPAVAPTSGMMPPPFPGQQ